MRRVGFLSGIFGIAAAVLLFCSPKTAQDTAGDSLFDLVPGPELADWAAKGAPEVYVGDDLFLYINGGAEIYHEFGFERVVVQDYVLQERSVALEIYEMKGADAAFGIYSFKTTSQGQELNIGSRASLEDYYLNFWKGKYLVTLTGFDEDQVTIQGLEKIAEAVAGNINDSDKAPAVTALLPAKGLNAAGVKYFRGPLALYNSYRFFKDEIPSLQEGVRGDYADGYSLFIFFHNGMGQGCLAFAQLCSQFGRDPRYSKLTELDKNTAYITDQTGVQFFLGYAKAYTFIVKGPASADAAVSIFTEIAARIID